MGTVSPQGSASEPLECGFDLDEEIRALVLDSAPRMFAVVQETDLAEGVTDAEVVAWGIVHEDGPVDVIGANGHTARLRSPERALWWYGDKKGERARLVWLGPAGAAALDHPVAVR
ncbi:hypothetical protein B7P34_29820 [Streptosporangium nondiastaticum]|uniref:Uncharacterized protein n=1 Tax=Streptosporangium nondiastaticum TaxID=35764 RepID=A0A9X7JJX6_9ACTN|nr:hypothetical protein [Streptosporangium nondiastaticum]PSJ25129.1 hypothetical protein B7P34_29820 [Streptosporangium nondiastaticum]